MTRVSISARVCVYNKLVFFLQCYNSWTAYINLNTLNVLYAENKPFFGPNANASRDAALWRHIAKPN